MKFYQLLPFTALVVLGSILPARAAALQPESKPRFDLVPGVVIDHSPAASGQYIGSPGLAVLPNGDFVAWGINYCAGMLSVPVDADLLSADSWTFCEFLPSSRAWNGGDMGAWLEGNAVVTPAGDLADMLRVQTKSPDEKAAIVRISPDGKKASFDPAIGFVPFPGGGKKFAIRFDPTSKLYWSLATIVPERHRAENPGSIRNTLALVSSPDLKQWTTRTVLLYHPDVKNHGFQYVEWLFEGDAIIAACRTAYDDGLGGAHNNHDANFLTFHRWPNFRKLTMADSTPAFTAAQP